MVLLVEFLDGLAECSPGGFTGGEDGGEYPLLFCQCLPSLGGGVEEGRVGHFRGGVRVGGGGGGGDGVTLGGLYFLDLGFLYLGGCCLAGAEVDGAGGGHFGFLSGW